MFMPSPRASAVPPPFHPTTKRYYIMGATSLPTGAAFATPQSHYHLLTEFAMGDLSVADVVASLTASAPTSPLEATYPV
jgi:hypothetical protein